MNVEKRGEKSLSVPALETIISKITQAGMVLLEGKSNALLRLDNQPLINGEVSSYILSVSSIDDSVIVLDEQIRPNHGRQMSHYHWVFQIEDHWTLKNCTKNSADLNSELLHLELIDLHERLQGLVKGKMPSLDVPAAGYSQAGYGSTFTGVLKNKSSRVFTLAAAALVLSGLFLTIFISTMQYGRMLKTVLTLSSTISESSQASSTTITRLSDEISLIGSEVLSLKEGVVREQEAFEFNKKQTSMNIRWLASRFPYTSSSRARAYNYLADRIDDASSYGEMVFQLSRLPESNEQAETLIATDRQNPMSLSNFESVFPELILPVSSEYGLTRADDFMISSGYIERRLSPLGSGGVRPHLAVDIINLDNIVKVSGDNRIIRDDTKSGYVQAVYDGTVQFSGFDWVYGWNLELKHELTPSVKEMYPDAEYWTTFYAHMKDMEPYDEGIYFAQGSAVGEIGTTGKSTGPHLHYEVRVYRPSGSDSNSYGSFDRINPFLEDSRRQS
ncbi:MAG: M23 family metallopeptidase [Spirochaetales bacterium]|nr:M23 family metallopeptidase [Spirochaetales bacterium]